MRRSRYARDEARIGSWLAFAGAPGEGEEEDQCESHEQAGGIQNGHDTSQNGHQEQDSIQNGHLSQKVVVESGLQDPAQTETHTENGYGTSQGSLNGFHPDIPSEDAEKQDVPKDIGDITDYTETAVHSQDRLIPGIFITSLIKSGVEESDIETTDPNIQVGSELEAVGPSDIDIHVPQKVALVEVRPATLSVARSHDRQPASSGQSASYEPSKPTTPRPLGRQQGKGKSRLRGTEHRQTKKYQPEKEEEELATFEQYEQRYEADSEHKSSEEELGHLYPSDTDKSSTPTPPLCKPRASKLPRRPRHFYQRHLRDLDCSDSSDSEKVGVSVVLQACRWYNLLQSPYFCWCP